MSARDSIAQRPLHEKYLLRSHVPLPQAGDEGLLLFVPEQNGPDSSLGKHGAAIWELLHPITQVRVDTEHHKITLMSTDLKLGEKLGRESHDQMGATHPAIDTYTDKDHVAGVAQVTFKSPMLYSVIQKLHGTIAQEQLELLEEARTAINAQQRTRRGL